ncbi:hypothetical protein WJX84_009509 [Apatococcus fuscideae]|uniref:Uncharacterized protein n=1 Tax=Apatococcus fuscideae TaxID=2026836 RepID=A0AAW1TEC7_9CHLO
MNQDTTMEDSTGPAATLDSTGPAVTPSLSHSRFVPVTNKPLSWSGENCIRDTDPRLLNGSREELPVHSRFPA